MFGSISFQCSRSLRLTISEIRWVSVTAMKTAAAMRWMRLRNEEDPPSMNSSGRAHHLVGILEREAGPDQNDKRERHEPHAARARRAACGLRRGPRRPVRRRRTSLPPKRSADQFAHPVAALVQQHQPDGDRNQQQVELADPAQRRRFLAVHRHVHLADGEAGTGAGMALAAGLGQVLGVDHGLGVGRRQDVVHAVAAGAVGDGLRSGFGCQAVERGIEADQPVRRHAELTCQPEIAVAASAGVADVGAVDRRGGVGVLDDVVLAVAIGAERRLGDALGRAPGRVRWRGTAPPPRCGTCRRCRVRPCGMPGISAASSSCALPWQRAQSGAPSLPALRARP